MYCHLWSLRPNSIFFPTLSHKRHHLRGEKVLNIKRVFRVYVQPGKPTHEDTSYRPISLLPILSKIFEKLLLKRLRSDVDLSHQIPGYQFGFRPGHSPNQQVHRVVNKIVTSLEGHTLCTAVFLDVAQAFDKVWHTGLLYKLKATLPGPYYLLLKSYLTHRYFQVRYNGTYSD